METVSTQDAGQERSIAWKMRKWMVAVLLVLLTVPAGCGARPTVEIVAEEKTYPEPDAVAESLESAGFEVERSEVFEGLDIETTRIKAVNGDDYLDICYHVPSADDMDEIVTYYTQNYKKYNLVSGTDVVYCYSSDSVEETAGLRE